MSAFAFQSREACEAYFKIPGNFEMYSEMDGAAGMLSIFKSLGWTVQNVPLPEPHKLITPMPVISAAHFSVQPESAAGIAVAVEEPVAPSPVASASERDGEASINARYNEYKSYLQAIFKPGDVICFVTIEHNLDNDREQETVHNTFATLEDALTKESFLNCVKANNSLSRNPRNTMPSIYVGMNTYPSDLIGQHLGRRQENVVEVRALQVDIDDAGNAATVVTAMQSCAKVPTPSIVVESSTGKRQGIWLVDEFPKDAAKPVMQAIAAEFGTDPAVAEIARVMRVPGFINRKPKYIDQPLAKLLSNTAMRYNRESFKVDTATVGKSERTSPEEYLDMPFIRKGGPYGGIYSHVLKIVGHYMSAKNIDDGDVMFAIVKEHINNNGCFERDGKTPFNWNEEQVRQQCRKLVSEWETGEEKSKPILLNMKPDVVAAPAIPAAQQVQQLPEIDTSEGYVRPVFPYWAIQGTSIWDGLVEPALKTSSKHAEFIAVPSIQIMLNALSGNGVRVGLGNNNLNIFVGLISPYGEFFKSSSCALAMDYFRHMGKLFSSKSDKEAAEGRIAVIQAGSPEGFGLRAFRINATRALLFNDELSKFVSKAGIEGSAFASDLLSWYGAGELGNGTSQTKNAFHFEAGKYTFGWLWATTDRTFNRCWPKLAGVASGLEDRMFFVVSPEKPKPTAPYSDPLFHEGAARTAQLIEKAIAQKTFNFESPEWYAKKVSGIDPRSMDLVQKLALYFCVDMGGSVIDGEHIDRAMALVQYRNQAAKFLEPIEADDDGGRLQKEILRELRQNRGKMRYRDLCNAMEYSRIELFKWNRIFQGLKSERLIHDFQEPTTPGKRATRMVGLAKQEED